jgi:recombination protein RecA
MTNEKHEKKAAEPAATPEVKETKPKKEPAAPKVQMSSAAVSMQKAIAAVNKTLGLKPFDMPNTTLPHVSTGSTTIDMLIGGSLAADGKSALCPGFPRRRITEVYGAESSGKTTLALSAIAKLQKQGGSAMFIDFEHHLVKKYAMDVGVQWDSGTFACIQPHNLEEGFTSLSIAIGTGVDLVVIDSVAAMVPKDEMAKNLNDPMKLGIVAALMAKFLPRVGNWLDIYPKDPNNKAKKQEGHPGTAIVLLNQTRSLISTGGGGGGGHGDGENTAGGKALKFYTTLRIRLSRIKSESIKRKDLVSGREINVPYGNLTQVKMVKSKLDGKQGHSTQVFIRYGHGIDDHYSLIEAAVTQKLVKKEGAWYSVDGQRFQGRASLRKYYVANPKAFNELKNKITHLFITGSTAIDPDEDLGEDDSLYETMERKGRSDEDYALEGVTEETIDETDIESDIPEPGDIES